MTSGMLTGDRDRAIRPQDDLFRHANGGWLERTAVPDDRARYGSFDILRDRSERDCHTIVEDLAQRDRSSLSQTEVKVADLYASFMDEATIEAKGLSPLAPFLQDVASLSSTDGLLALTGRWLRSGIPGLVAPIVWTDDKDSSRTLVYLEQSGLGLPDEAFYREDSYAPIREAYLGHVQRMLSLLGVVDAAEAAARVLAIETDLAGHHWDVVASRDSVKSYNPMTLADLNERADLGWAAFADELGATAEQLAEVVVRQPSYLDALPGVVRAHPLSAWQEWLRWHLVHAFAPYLRADLVRENFEFYGRTLTGMPQLRDRWKRGIALVESALGEALGEAYVARHYPPAAAARMNELVGNLVEAFRRDFATLEWMSPATREAALAKLATFRPKIGHPETWRDYSPLAVDRSDLFGNVCRAAAYEVDRNLAKLGKPVDRDEWFMTPQTINAYYNPGMNEIVFPAAILQPPFFDVEADDAVNYGGIGAVIGHEIGHGFDDQGSRYDGEGNLRDWWTAEDRARFEARTQALIAQFDALSPLDAPEVKVNGSFTVGENIGDLGGLTIGLAAYRIACEQTPAPVLDGLTGDQRFFYGWAQIWRGKSRPEEARRLIAVDPHAPQNCRGNIARNLTAFHEAFGTTPEDGMWLAPEDRVTIF